MKPVFLFIPHTHWEGAVFKTRQAYLEMGLPNILRALRLLERHPHYRFTLDQVCYVRPFLERYPEAADAFRRFVAEGRLAIVGGTDVMLDVNMPGGESFVRQVQYGKGYYRRTLGVDVTVGWQLDTFGHHAQMPQLLRLAGYGSFWFFRGVASWEVASEFDWEGLDGTRIPAFWLPQGYAVTYGSPPTPDGFSRFIEERWERLAPFARGPERVGLAGADVCVPEDHVPELVAAFNRRPDAPFELRLAVPAQFEALVAQRPERPVVTGELNPIFQGTYSSRIELKQWTRQLEGLLAAAEALGVILRDLGEVVDDDVVWRAWEPLLFNQAHDLMSGVMTDPVYQDTVASFAFSRRLAQEEVGARLARYVGRVDTRGDGIAVVVANPSGWARTDAVEVEVGFSDPWVRGVRLGAPDGSAAPVQLVEAERDGDGALLRGRIAFLARDVPALGHAVYRLQPVTVSGPEVGALTAPAAAAVLESDVYGVEVDATGAIARLRVRATGWDALRAPGNVVARQADHGDLWEPYRPLDGGSRIAMGEVHAAPARGLATFSDEETGAGTATRGPVFAQYEVAHPFGGTGAFTTRVRVYAGLRRIEVRTAIRDSEGFVRYRALFPTAVAGGQCVHEIPFGAIQRPAGIEFPAQTWVDYGDGRQGVALLNRGLPGNNVDDGTLLLSLSRSTRIVAYGFGGGYEPGMSSDTGLQLGKELTFDYALVPHAGDWRRAGLWREGAAFNRPLSATTASGHDGALPARWGFLQVSHDHVALSSLTPGRDGTVVVRLYEAAGLAARGVTVRLAAGVTGAEEVNLLEDPGAPVAVVDGDAVRVDFRPFEIKTLRLTPGAR